MPSASFTPDGLTRCGFHKRCNLMKMKSNRFTDAFILNPKSVWNSYAVIFLHLAIEHSSNRNKQSSEHRQAWWTQLIEFCTRFIQVRVYFICLRTSCAFTANLPFVRIEMKIAIVLSVFFATALVLLLQSNGLTILSFFAFFRFPCAVEI